ncbi:M24 family metallopeptidase [Bacillus marinisedimentorum]|uniref:M24 family metallopeptidase n=1 Tax=Bacillus marinisedimentorum TaxID=1821260 RepID=UPI0007E191D7|nr:Xaa-Pro peptidase family protein [Bacillus marinisedimentorum]
MNNRLKRMTEWLKEKNINAAFITSTPNVFYLSGFYSDPHERLLGLLLFPDAEPILVLPAMEKQQAKNAGWDYPMIGYSDIDDPWQLIKDRLDRQNIRPGVLAVEKSHMTVERYEHAAAAFGNPDLVSAEGKLQQLRLIKDEQETAVLREAAKLADYGVEVGTAAIKEGVTEMEILARIEYELKKQGIREMSFSTIVLTGENTAAPHGNPGKNRVKKGDLVLFDLGVVLDGYCSDITRTVAVGDVSAKQREIYETVLRAQEEAVRICRPGTTIGDLDKTARSIITEAGYGDYFTHRIGHGLGIEVHEFPSLNEKNTGILENGMALTIEPGIYLPGTGGVRIEDDIVITANGADILTQYPKELQIVKG